MTLMEFIIVTILSVIVFAVWEIVMNVVPAYKRLKRVEAEASLTESMKYLNEDAFLNAKIRDGHYFHDDFYKFLLGVLCSDFRVTLSILKRIKYVRSDEERIQRFRKELNSFDEDTKKQIDSAIYATGKILFLRDTFMYLLMCFKFIKAKRNYEKQKVYGFVRSRMMQSAELVTYKMMEEEYATTG